MIIISQRKSPTMEFKGRVAVVFAASRGIGRAVGGIL
jgi:hypothetical protein